MTSSNHFRPGQNSVKIFAQKKEEEKFIPNSNSGNYYANEPPHQVQRKLLNHHSFRKFVSDEKFPRAK